ncbi:MAG: hypothetical protein EOO22_20770 [Comamonadaceae bacterium]|nr:MAG: hypothetical protein EOO22_20770 [Comamonadaceae bacterium]
MELQMLRFFSVIAVAFVLSGCAAVNIKRPVTEEELAGTKRVAVVSMLGDTFHGVHVGLTVFQNRQFTGEVPEWEVDKFASTTALKLLRAGARFGSASIDRMGVTPRTLRAEGGQRLRDAARAQGFDKLVVIVPATSSNHPFFVPGFGAFQREIFNGARRCVYAAYIVEVQDVAKGRPIAWDWGGSDASFGGDAPCVTRSDSPVSVKQSFSDYSTAEKQAMRVMLEERIEASMRYALDNVKLLPPSK